MKITKMYEKRKKQLVGLSKKYRLKSIENNADKLLQNNKSSDITNSLNMFTDDYMKERKQGKYQKREEL